MIDNTAKSNSHKRRVYGYMDSSPGGETGSLPWVTKTPLSTALPSAHRFTDPQEQDHFFMWGSRSKAPCAESDPDVQVLFWPGDTRNYASDSAPHSPVRLQRRIRSRMSSTRHAVMRAPSVRTGCG